MEGEEAIQYVDVMSLYPWVCKYFKFAVYRPIIHLECGHIPTMLAKEGLVRYMVLPHGILSLSAPVQVKRPPFIVSL
jgi:hypothetical protein